MIYYRQTIVCENRKKSDEQHQKKNSTRIVQAISSSFFVLSRWRRCVWLKIVDSFDLLSANDSNESFTNNQVLIWVLKHAVIVNAIL